MRILNHGTLHAHASYEDGEALHTRVLDSIVVELHLELPQTHCGAHNDM